MGLDALTTARVLEAVGRGTQDMGVAFSICAHLFACSMTIVEHGEEKLKQRLLPGLCSGALVGANAITEPEAGSDAFSLTTRCEKEGDWYFLTGSKSYVTNGPIADVYIVYSTQNRDHGFLGICAFVVEKGTTGLDVGKAFPKVGLESSPTSPIYLDRCRVGAENRLGHEGSGSTVFTHSMHWERACLFALYLGLLDRQLDETVAFAKQRRQFGKPIGKFQAIAHRIAEMKLRLESARLLLYRACWLKDQGKDASMAIFLSKIATSEAAVASSLDAVQIQGGMGVVSGMSVEQALRDSLASTIFSGTSDVLRNLIARGLGL